jgi:hypothetical protein
LEELSRMTRIKKRERSNGRSLFLMLNADSRKPKATTLYC